jgi:hypothetical protein
MQMEMFWTDTDDVSTRRNLASTHRTKVRYLCRVFQHLCARHNFDKKFCCWLDAESVFLVFPFTLQYK